MNVPGMTEDCYRLITAGLDPGTEIWDAEQAVNELVGVKKPEVSLNTVTKLALGQSDLDAIYISSEDGMLLAGKSLIAELQELQEGLVAVAPQLCQRQAKSLIQANLPYAPLITIPFDLRAVSFAGRGAVYMIFVHEEAYPDPESLKGCRELADALTWYCSERGVC